MKISQSLAAILVEQNEPLQIESIEFPSELEIGQVLVKLHYSGICGSQLGEIRGVKGDDKFLPHLMGHEGCATVLEVGPGVKTIADGDLVVLHWKKGDGIQSNPPKYKLRGEKINAGWITTFNEYAIVSENRCTTIPKDTNKKIASLFGCAITTGFGVIENNANLKIGESIVIYGSGGIGLNMIQAASLRNAFPIIAVDLTDEKLHLAKQIGATHTINSNYYDPEKRINEILGKNRLDVFIDNTGIPSVIEMGYKITDINGRVVLVGVPRIGNNINLFSLPLHFGKTILGSHGGDIKPEKDILRYLNLIKNREINLEILISQFCNLEDINFAISKLTKGEIPGRLMIKF
ncbi:zinc-binding dehydrogenase [Prochlorococcus sp. AH-716-E17]|nr:zinc-binding dehydrogenase [Prochlorococcus sp. AH-716-E17]